jgi:hypothetical protein
MVKWLSLVLFAIGACSTARADDASPIVSLMPAGPVDFSLIPVGTPSDSQPIRITNVSGAPITLGPPTSDSSAFQIDTTGFDKNLMVNTSTTVHVTFVPETPSEFNAHIFFFADGVAAPIAETTVTGVGVLGTRVNGVIRQNCSCGLAPRVRTNGAVWAVLVAAIAMFVRRRARRLGLFALAIGALFVLPSLARADDASPIVSVVPTTTIDFGMVPVASPSDPEPIGIKNLSAAAITLGTPTSDLPDFVVDTENFEKTLAVKRGDDCSREHGSDESRRLLRAHLVLRGGRCCADRRGQRPRHGDRAAGDRCTQSRLQLRALCTSIE